MGFIPPLNPKGGTYKLPDGYVDLGWQLNTDNSEVVKKCHDAGHKREEFDNSLRILRGTDTIYTCHQCKNIYHIDSSD